jgi:hypothetical protein
MTMANNKPPMNGHGQFLKARYHHSDIADYEGNPLIEALPPVFSFEDWFTFLENPARISKEEQSREAHLRSHFILRLQRFYQPLPKHLDLAMRIDQILRQGYVGRNPVTADRGEILQELYDSGQQGHKDHCVYTDYQPILSISLIGASGMGKSTTTEHILSRYPQVLYHEEYALHQIVWMKLDCPPDGSIKQLALDFIQELDRLLGTEFSKGMSSRKGTDELLHHVKSLAATYSLGLLVIDEIQNLSVKKSGGREAMMNFFQELCNTLRVPILLMGTMKAMKILQLDFRQARRNAAVGSFIWDPMKMDENWRFLLESIWEYQWLREPIPLTDEMVDFLYQETQGVVAVLSSLFILAQFRALRSNQEQLTEDLFKRTLDKDLSPIKPMLSALRSGDPRRIARYEDMEPIDFEKMIEREQLSTKASALKRLARKKPNLASNEEKAIETLEMMGYEKSITGPYVTEAVLSGAGTHQAIVKKVLSELLDDDSSQPETVIHDPDDLRAYSSDASADELRQRGVIKGI